MKYLLALLATILLSFSTAACGDHGDGTSTSSRAPSNPSPTSQMPLTGISNANSHAGYLNDSDNDKMGDHVARDDSYHDSDDSEIVATTHDAKAPDKRVIIAVVQRYYAALATGNGVKACSMLLPSLAQSAPEDYGLSPGPSFLRGGKTCPAIIVMLSKHFHARLAGHVEVTGVHARGDNALALLGSTTMPASDVSLERRGNAWKVTALIGDVLP